MDTFERPVGRVDGCGAEALQDARALPFARGPFTIAAYFEADTYDAGRVAQCFAENAVVIDEHREHRGRTAIANWKAAATARYHYTSEPIGIETAGMELTVTARLVGDFPGSPVNLTYRFTLEDDKIFRLEITS